MNRPHPNIPDSKLCAEATAFVREVSPRFLFHHCTRTFLFGDALGRRGGLRYDREALYLSSVLHDIGLLDRFQGSQRFEVEGADHAAEFLRRHGAATELVDLVWDAVALHTSVGIANRRRPEIALTAFGTALDISGVGADDIEAIEVQRIVEEWPRDNMKAAMLDLVLSHIRAHPRQVAVTWMSEVGHKHLPGFKCPTFSALLADSPFPE